MDERPSVAGTVCGSVARLTRARHAVWTSLKMLTGLCPRLRAAQVWNAALTPCREYHSNLRFHLFRC